MSPPSCHLATEHIFFVSVIVEWSEEYVKKCIGQEKRMSCIDGIMKETDMVCVRYGRDSTSLFIPPIASLYSLHSVSTIQGVIGITFVPTIPIHNLQLLCHLYVGIIPSALCQLYKVM